MRYQFKTQVRNVDFGRIAREANDAPLARVMWADHSGETQEAWVLTADGLECVRTQGDIFEVPNYGWMRGSITADGRLWLESAMGSPEAGDVLVIGRSPAEYPEAKRYLGQLQRHVNMRTLVTVDTEAL